MSEFFLKVKKHDDVSKRSVVVRKRITEAEFHDFCHDLLLGDIYRVDFIHIERLTNEN